MVVGYHHFRKPPYMINFVVKSSHLQSSIGWTSVSRPHAPWNHAGFQVDPPNWLISDPWPYEGRKSISQYRDIQCIYIYIIDHSELRSCCLMYDFGDMRWLVFPGSPNLVLHETSKPTASEFSSSETSSPGSTPKASWQRRTSHKALVRWFQPVTHFRHQINI